MMDKYICIHGHFYQPPRENAWLEEIELQDSAYPYHDWNDRITAECYAPNSAARLLDSENRIVDIVNNYSKISFNFGPTLLSWLERHRPSVHQALIEADRLSLERFSGHGSALAQVYNHMIMPLANRRDKYTQVIWGIKDFQKRFGRFPEGMWLPETAVDRETLAILAELGIKFTILAPRQARRIRKIGKGTRWHELKGSVDPTMPYLYRLPAGRSITLFFYDGPISQDIAFSGLLSNGESFAKRLLSAFTDHREWPQLVHIATDGETYGHHHRFGEMALSYCLRFIESSDVAKLTNYGEYLEKHPPTHMVEIFENSSWSCVHGIERWRDNCGCHTGMHAGWSQAWRKPLREALDWLRDKLIPLYEGEAAKYLTKPWQARDNYADVLLDRAPWNVNQFFEKHAVRALSQEEKVRVLSLLEMQRHAMLMFTSCGWFFDELSGIETTQVMQYSARAIQLVERLFGITLEPDYLERLAKAPSNIPQHENGAKTYELFIKPTRIDFLRLGAHYAISSLFDSHPESMRIYCYTANSQAFKRREAGGLKLVTGTVSLISDTTWESDTLSFATLHLGAHHINGAVRNFLGEATFRAMEDEIGTAFERADIAEIIRLMDKNFGSHNYSLWHLFRDEQRRIINEILKASLINVETSYRQIHESNYALQSFLQSLHVPIPKPLSLVDEYLTNVDLQRVFAGENLDIKKLESLANEVKRWSIAVDKATVGFVACAAVNALMAKVNQEADDIVIFEKIKNVLDLLGSIYVEMDLWEAQNIYFSLAQRLYAGMKGRADAGDELAQRWVTAFLELSPYIRVRVP
jgi:alpha-amylase/alpha-mannosidase (GH57 family)